MEIGKSLKKDRNIEDIMFDKIMMKKNNHNSNNTKKKIVKIPKYHNNANYKIY
jgi:hypothetical protein